MGRKKLNLTYICDATAREKTFNHKKNGLMKKLDEIKMLCGVDICAVIYNPPNSNPEVWPSNSGVINLMEKFEMLSETEKTFRSVNHEGFLNQEIAKVRKKLQKLTVENKENYMKELLFGCLGGNLTDFSMNDNDRSGLCNFIDQYLKHLLHHQNISQNNLYSETGESSSMVTAMTADMTASAVTATMTPTAMTVDMAPTAMNAEMALNALNEERTPNAMAKEGSFFFLDPPIINYPQLNNDLHSIISSYKGSYHVDSLETNLLNAPTINSPQVTCELQSMISSNPRQEHDNALASNLLSNEEIYTPVMYQDVFYDPNQNQNQNFFGEMLKFGEQTGFPWMEYNNDGNHNLF